MNSPLFFTSVFCSPAPFSGLTLLHIHLWGPPWPLGGMSTVGIYPVDETFPPLAAFLCLVQASGTEGYKGHWQSNLSTISPGNSIISLHSLETFAWKKGPGCLSDQTMPIILYYIGWNLRLYTPLAEGFIFTPGRSFNIISYLVLSYVFNRKAFKLPTSIPHAHHPRHREAILSDFTVWDNMLL